MFVPTSGPGRGRFIYWGRWRVGGLLIAAISLRHCWWIAGALIVSYALAWVSHFFVEHNRPATFEHPLWSWWADQKMVALMLAGKMNAELARGTTGHN